MSELPEAIAEFTQSARWVDGIVSVIPEAAWSGRGLGEWHLRALVGHTSRALLTVENYLAVPADHEDLGSAEEYYDRVKHLANTDSKTVLQRGISAGQALGESPSKEFAAIVERVTKLLQGADDRVISTVAGGILLSNYLRTRTCELIVHGLDIARAANLEFEPPRESLSRTLSLAASLAVHSGRGAEVLMALTGRASLPTGFSVME